MRWPNLSLYALTEGLVWQIHWGSPVHSHQDHEQTTATAFPCIPTERRLSGAKRSPDLCVVSFLAPEHTLRAVQQPRFPRQKANAFLPFHNPNSKAGGIRKEWRMMLSCHRKAANLDSEVKFVTSANSINGPI